MKPNPARAIRMILTAALLLLAPEQPALAAPSSCLFPGTTARAKKLAGAGPGACAMNTCRVEGRKATKVIPCDADPACITSSFSVSVWQAEDGPWAGLPACPAWTNTAAWQ